MDNLNEREELYRQIVEYSFETTVIHSNHKILYINEAGADFLRASDKHELIGANVVDVFTEEYRDFIVERIRKGEEEKKVGQLVETKIYRLDGSVIEVELFCHPVIFGESEAMQSIIRDITPRKEAERKLIEVMTPIVPVSKNVAVIPLVGFVDEKRATHILESIPSKIRDNAWKHIIVDVSGMYNISEEVLDFLVKFQSILIVMGTSPIITGIRAELAYKLVHTCGGRDISSIVTKANVEQALYYLNE
ncbi:PAS domain S-box protein [Metabacillus sp. HB246100]